MPKVAEIKDAFVCYRSYVEAIRLLPEDKRWGFFDGILYYALDGIEPTFSGTESAMFTLMRANIDSCNKRYATNVQNGKKGGRPPTKETQTKPTNNPKKPKHNPKDNVNVNETLLGTSEGGGLTTPPPAKDKFLLGGEWHEYYIADDGERRARKCERPPQ